MNECGVAPVGQLDVRIFIAQNLPKYRFHSSLDYTFLSLSVSSIIF